MTHSDDAFPDPPDLPSFTVEEEEPPIPIRPDRTIDRHEGTGLERHTARLREENIDADAARVVRRLERSGFQAYLVGGCVRDLLLDKKPKDFDVATDARPEDMRALFRNCRIIGRRFRLAHVLFAGDKVIEVATFRRNPALESPEEDASEAVDDLLIRSDNVFGEAHEDALRRDFTINALFYDLDRRQVLDWCGGMTDIERRTIHTIGDPGVRFREDPIRILRAIKFAARLDLGIAPQVYDAMVSFREELARAAKPRVFEELLRLMRGAAAHRSMYLLWESGIMAVLLPELAAFLDDADATSGGAERFFRRMDAVDRLTQERGRPLGDIALWSALIHESIDEACSGVPDRGVAANEFLDSMAERVAVPRRLADAVRRIIAVLPRLAAGRAGKFATSEYIGAALDVLEVDLIARQKSTDIVHRQRAQYAPHSDSKPGGSHSGGGGGHRPRWSRTPRRAPR